MKIRLTILTENNIPRPAELTEEEVAAAWQLILNLMVLNSNDKAIVESVEFVEEGGA